MQDGGSLHDKIWRDQAASLFKLGGIGSVWIWRSGHIFLLFDSAVPGGRHGLSELHGGAHRMTRPAAPRPFFYFQNKKSRRGSEGPPAGVEGKSRKD